MLSLEETLTILTNAQLPFCAAFVQAQEAEMEHLHGEAHGLRLENAQLRERFRETLLEEFGNEMADAARFAEQAEAGVERLRAKLNKVYQDHHSISHEAAKYRERAEQAEALVTRLTAALKIIHDVAEEVMRTDEWVSLWFTVEAESNAALAEAANLK